MEKALRIAFLVVLFFSGLGLFSMSFKRVLDVYFYIAPYATLLVIGNLVLMLVGAAAFLGAIYLSKGVIYK